LYSLIPVAPCHGATGIKEYKRYWLGTNAYRVVSTAPCPVLTIPEGSDRQTIKHISLPLDITKDTRSQVSAAILMAKLFNATVHISTVSTFLEEFVIDLSKIKKLLKETAQTFEKAGIEYTTKVLRHDQIARSVLNYSKKINADLIMLATAHSNKWNDRLLGSTAKRVVTHSPIPILSVKSREQKESGQKGEKKEATEG
jgi:nucleotide-binding universal stress UspA family protein